MTGEQQYRVLDVTNRKTLETGLSKLAAERIAEWARVDGRKIEVRLAVAA